MILIVIPFLSMRLGSADAGTDPAGSTTRRAYDLIAKGLGPGYSGPLQLVAQVRTPADRSHFTGIPRAVAATPGVAGAGAVSVIAGIGGRPDVAVADVYPDGSPQDASTTDLLHRVRSQVVPTAARGTGLRVLVGGNTAIFDDFSHVLTRKLPRCPCSSEQWCSSASCCSAVDGRLPEHRRPAHRGGDEPGVGRRRRCAARRRRHQNASGRPTPAPTRASRPGPSRRAQHHDVDSGKREPRPVISLSFRHRDVRAAQPGSGGDGDELIGDRYRRVVLRSAQHDGVSCRPSLRVGPFADGRLP
jgi:hypothetical protein